MVYDRVAPGDPERDDMRTALICYMLACVMGDPKKTKNLKPADFLLDFKGTDKPKKRKTTAEVKNTIMAAMGGPLMFRKADKE